MEMKQIDLDLKRIIKVQSIKSLISFVHNLQQKLSTVKRVNEKLNQLISIVSNTHQTILQDLTTIKTILNQITIEQDQDPVLSIVQTKSEWDDNQIVSSRKLNVDVHQEDSLISNCGSSSYTPSTIENAQTSSRTNRSSNLKKSGGLSSIIKSAKSVSFTLDQNIPHQQQKKFIPTFQQFSKEKKHQTLNEMTRTTVHSLSLDFPKENQLEIVPNIGKTLTNIRIHEIEPKNGDYLRLLNISNSQDYDLSEHFLQQINHSKLLCRFRFPFNTIIRAGQTITIWCGRSRGIIPQPPHLFLWREQRKWETKAGCITFLAKPNGQSIAWFRNSHRVKTDQSSSDILLLHSKTNIGSSDVSTISSNSIKSGSLSSARESLFSRYTFLGNNKPPFAHSPNNPTHPDYNGTTLNIPNHLRSQIHQKNRINPLLNRAKSSSFSTNTNWKQDLTTCNFFPTRREKQTTLQT